MYFAFAGHYFGLRLLLTCSTWLLIYLFVINPPVSHHHLTPWCSSADVNKKIMTSSAKFILNVWSFNTLLQNSLFYEQMLQRVSKNVKFSGSCWSCWH